MTKLQTHNFPLPFLIYGEKPRAERLCSEALSLGIKPISIILNAPEGAPDYCGVPVLPQKALLPYAETGGVVIVPAFSWHGAAENDLRALDERLPALAMREIEFFARLAMAAETVDPPAAQTPWAGTLIGTQLGFVLGGVEAWAADLYKQLKAAGTPVQAVEALQESRYQYVGPAFYGIDPADVIPMGQYERYSDYVLEMLAVLAKAPPKVYVDNGSYRLMAAVWLAKKKLGLPIKVISVLHGDAGIIYDRLRLFDEIIDQIVAVSEIPAARAAELLPHRAADISVKLNIPAPAAAIPQFDGNGPLKLAYAARLEPANKRSLWLTEMMDGLLERGVDFTLDIAGDGDCRQALAEYIERKGLSERVRLLGTLPREEMAAFWAAREVYLNFSKTEGGPLTLLEAMGIGLAPVATDAGCGKRLFRDGENSMVISSPEEAACAVAKLAADRELLEKIRRNAHQTLQHFYQTEGPLAAAFR